MHKANYFSFWIFRGEIEPRSQFQKNFITYQINDMSYYFNLQTTNFYGYGYRSYC